MESSSSKLPPPNPSMPYRDDCWSEGATAALIDAWGDRYLDLNRGNLRQKDWQSVADTVNSRRAGPRRPVRTDSQCKNRIDTLKKKYKAEKARVLDSGGVFSSPWPFFPKLDVLVGNSPKKTPSPSPPLALPLPLHRKPSPSPLPAARAVEIDRTPTVLSDSFRRNYSAAAAAAAAAADDSSPALPSFRMNYSAAAAAAAAAADESESSASPIRERSLSSLEPPPPVNKRPRLDMEGENGKVDGVRKLALAIERFAEIYEKVEGEKQKEVMELERKRIEFAKGMEFKRMQMFVDSQVKMERMKRAKRGDAGEQASAAIFSCLLQPCFFSA